MALSEMFHPSQIEMFKVSISSLAEAQGVGEMILKDWAPNTRAALAVAEYARDQGKLFLFKDAAMTAFWRDGSDLEDEAVLTKLLLDVGLDVTAGLSARSDTLYLNRVDAMREEANAANVTGIPTMVFENGAKIIGAQRWDVFVETAKEAKAKQL